MFIPKGRINIIPALVQAMACCRTGDKPLPEAILTQFTDANILGDELTIGYVFFRMGANFIFLLWGIIRYDTIQYYNLFPIRLSSRDIYVFRLEMQCR